MAAALDNAKRILIYGVTGSGKTTLAARLSAATGLPWHSVDELTWEPGWVEVPADEQRRKIERICAGERWILDTAYAKWLDVPLARVELIVALDYPRWISLSRLVRRTLIRLVDRQTTCNGNRETLRNVFSKDSLIVWHFTSFPRKRDRIRRWAADPDGPNVLVFTRPRQAEYWIRTLSHATLTATGQRAPNHVAG